MKKILSVCMALVMLLACIPLVASADGTPTFAAGNAAAHPGDTIEIPVMIENNPGIIGLHVVVSFDTDVLLLQNVTAGTLFPQSAMTFGGSYNTDTFGILWDDGTARENHTDDGTFAILTFLVKADAPIGDTAVIVNYNASSTIDVNTQNVAFTTRNGVVTVSQPEVGGWSFTDDSTLYTYEGISGVKYIGGLENTYPFISDYIETSGGWTYNIETNESDMESTGAKLLIYNEDGDLVEEYYTVLYGDINGDGVFDGADITFLTYAMGFVLDETWADFAFPDEYPQSFAADVNHDMVLDGGDITCISYMIGCIEDIDQSCPDPIE